MKVFSYHLGEIEDTQVENELMQEAQTQGIDQVQQRILQLQSLKERDYVEQRELEELLFMENYLQALNNKK